MNFRLVIFSALIGCSVQAQASSFKDYSTENEWNSSAISGMGGVGLLSESSTDKFFTDASLSASGTKSAEFEWFGLHLSFSKDAFNTVTEVQKLASNESASGTTQALSAINTLRSLFGRRLSGGLNINILGVNLGKVHLLPYMSGNILGEVRSPAWPRAEFVGDIYAGIGVGYSMAFLTKYEVGINLRPGVRGYSSAHSDVGDLINSTANSDQTGSTEESKILKKGVGYYMPVDIGFGYVPIKNLRASLSIRDLGGAAPLSYVKGDGYSETPVYPMRISTGVASNVYEKGPHIFQVASEIQDMMNLGSPSGLWYRWQWAAQYLFKPSAKTSSSLFALRLGLQSGYPSVGIAMNLYILKLEGTMYQKEAGYYLNQRVEKKYSLKASSQFSF